MKIFRFEEKAIAVREAFVSAKTREEAIHKWENGDKYLCAGSWVAEDDEIECESITELTATESEYYKKWAPRE